MTNDGVFMPKGTHKKISNKYCPRFSQTAVEMGFITAARLKEALSIQVDDGFRKKNQLIGAILFEKDWMTSNQIELVLNQMLKQMRIEKNEEKAMPKGLNNS